MKGFPYGMEAPSLMKHEGFFDWLDETNLEEYVDYQIVCLPGGILGIAFKDKNVAALYKLRWHGIK